MKKATQSSSRHRLLIICLCYGFCAINFIIPFFVNQNMRTGPELILGIVMLCMIPISCYDNRDEMRGKLYMILCCIMHFALAVFVSFLYSWYYMILFFFEALITLSVICIQYRRNHTNGSKKRLEK